MTAASQRRWPRWWLTPFVLVLLVLGTWLGCELNWVRQRRSALADGRVDVDQDPFASTLRSIEAPSLLSWFGEPGYADLSFRCSNGDFELTPAERVELDRLQRLFPEATIGFYWLHPPESTSPLEPASPPATDLTGKSQDAARKKYLKFPPEIDYQMDNGTMGTERSGMR
jgi:hypothetical protein